MGFGFGVEDAPDIRSLDSVRGSLVTQEDTIILALIERAAFSENRDTYTDVVRRNPGWPFFPSAPLLPVSDSPRIDSVDVNAQILRRYVDEVSHSSG